MPFLDNFRLREPARLPAKWLVPWWWAFASDERYKINVCKDRLEVRNRSRPASMCLQDRRRSLKRHESYQQRHRQLPAPTSAPRRLSLCPISAEPHTCGQNGGVVAQQPYCYKPALPETKQVHGSTPHSTTCDLHRNFDRNHQQKLERHHLNRIDQHNQSPSHDPLGHCSICLEKGQSERQVRRSSSYASAVKSPGRGSNCDSHKLGPSQFSLEPYSMTKTNPMHPYGTAHQNQRSVGRLPNHAHQDDENEYREGVTELQRRLIGLLAPTQHERHHDTQTDCVNRNCISATRSVPCHGAVNRLFQPDITRNRAIRSNSETSTLPHRPCLYSTPLLDDPTFYPSHKNINQDATISAQTTQCELHPSHISIVQSPSRRAIIPDPQPVTPIHSPHRFYDCADSYEHSRREGQYMTDDEEYPDYDCDHDHDQIHTYHGSPSPLTPHEYANPYTYINDPPTQHDHLEHQIHFHTHDYHAQQSCPPPHDSQSHQLTHDQYTNIHYHQEPSQSPRDHHPHHQDMNHDPALPFAHELESPWNPADHLRFGLGGDYEQFDCGGGGGGHGDGHGRGRRMSYVRRRGD